MIAGTLTAVGSWRDYLGLALVGVVGVHGVVGGLHEDAAAVSQLDRGREAAGEARADRGSGRGDLGA